MLRTTTSSVSYGAGAPVAVHITAGDAQCGVLVVAALLLAVWSTWVKDRLELVSTGPGWFFRRRQEASSLLWCLSGYSVP